MSWIRDRILAEQRKHGSNGLDWARLAEQKILSSIKSRIEDSGAILHESDFQTGEIEFSYTGELIPVEALGLIIKGQE